MEGQPCGEVNWRRSWLKVENPAAEFAGRKIHHCRGRGCGYVGPVNWQQVLSLLIVAVAATALLWGRFRRRKFRFGQATACGCVSNASPAAQPAIIFRARKGERPQVHVKMK
jgi:hypothetical protein